MKFPERNKFLFHKQQCDISLFSWLKLFSYWQRSKISLYALVSFLLLFLLVQNSSSIFFTHVPFPANVSPEKISFLPENVAGNSKKMFSLHSSRKMPSNALFSVKDEILSARLKTHLPILRKNRNLAVFAKRSNLYHTKRRKRRRLGVKVMVSQVKVNKFEARVTEFFTENSCKFRFFMTWVSSVKSFGEREMFATESLFRTHSNECLIIASSSLDSNIGMNILKPFSEKGFKVIAISPDFNYLFKDTPAENWYKQLKQGNVNPGEVSLGQNLSNLLRLGLLYRFGGIYLDTDVLVLKSFKGLRNVIGAQTIDLDTKKWSRLNNAVMIFDEGHPLLYKFIQEFALTFDGNKWGHNGPYLVSRVVSRVIEREGFNLTVLPPLAFYPVDWSKIGSLFEGPKSLSHGKWLVAKLKQIRSRSFAVHLWNKQSREFKIENDSIIHRIMVSSCVFCSNSSSAIL